MNTFNSDHVIIIDHDCNPRTIPPDVYPVACVSADFAMVTPRERRIIRKYPRLRGDLSSAYQSTFEERRLGRCTKYGDMYILITRLTSPGRPTLMNLKHAIGALVRQSFPFINKFAFNLSEDDLSYYEYDTIIDILCTEFGRYYTGSEYYAQIYVCTRGDHHVRLQP